MTWRYEIATGRLTHAGNEVGVGYSGALGYKNDPTYCAVQNKGPIPPGRYTIGAPRHTAAHGPFVLPLTPDPDNEMYGRAGFLIHGDSIAHPGEASQGCIVLARYIREQIHSSGDTELEVTEEQART